MKIISVLLIAAIPNFASAQEEEDAQLLMFAAYASFMQAIVPQCEKYLPGYRVKFADAFAVADEVFFQPNGIDNKMRAEAATFAELDVGEMVERFEHGTKEKKIDTCNKSLSELATALVP